MKKIVEFPTKGRMSKREMYKKKGYIILIALFAGYLIFNGILLVGHELWRDEANVWLLSRDTTPWQLIGEIKYQGHPCLWYLVVMPFAKIGLPFPAISVLSFTVMAAAAGVFIWQAPFSPVTKAVCLISPIFSYYYPVVARNYCLTALLLILLAYYYPRRNGKRIMYGILLGLLVQTDTIALIIAGLVSVMWLLESVQARKFWETAAKGLWIPLASFFLLIVQFLNVSDSPAYTLHSHSLGEMLREIRNFSLHILTRMTGQGEKFDLFLILLFLAVGVLLSYKLRNPLPVLVVVGEFLYQVIFTIVVYQLHIWHYISICFTLIWFLWLGCRKENDIVCDRRIELSGQILAEALLVLLGVTMFIRWNAAEESSSLDNALYGLYSDGVHVADYISKKVGPEEIIVSVDVPEASTVLAYLGKEYTFYYAGTGQQESYARYDKEQDKEIDYEMLLLWIEGTFPDANGFYLLEGPSSCIRQIPDEAKRTWDICYETKEETARGENYTLYFIPVP